MFQPADFFSLLLFAINITAPVFALIFLGLFLKRSGLLDDDFIKTASKLVFNVGLPVMLFGSVAARDFSQLINPQDIFLLVGTSALIFVIASWSSRWFVSTPRDKGVFVQGAFRGNLLILGMAFCANAYGEAGVAIAVLPMALVVILYNVLSVYTLTASLNTARNSPLKLLVDVLRNPLIIGIIAGLVYNLSTLPIPKPVAGTIDYLSQLTLPLALICIGAALNLQQVAHSAKAALAATFIKLVLTPVLMVLFAISLGDLDKMHLGVLFLLASSPSAAAGFIMVKAMGGNSDLAASIVVLTTLCALLTVTGGLVTLAMYGII